MLSARRQRPGARGGQLAMNGAHVAVIDSYLSDFKEVNSDPQALGGWSGPGPFKIVNNYLEAAGENVMFRGEIRGFPTWSLPTSSSGATLSPGPGRGRPSSRRTTTHGWTIKNLLELKNARRVLIHSNRFECNWADGQPARRSSSRRAIRTGARPGPGSRTSRSSTMSSHDIDSGVNIRGVRRQEPGRDAGQGADPEQPVRRGRHDSRGRDGPSSCSAGRRTSRSSTTRSCTVPAPNTFVMFDQQPPAPGLVLRNNILSYGLYGMYGNGVGSGTAALEAFAPGAIFDWQRAVRVRP